MDSKQYRVSVIGAGLAGSEAALVLSGCGIKVSLYEMRPHVTTPVHHTSDFAELVCSNSLKSTKPDSAAGMLKEELRALGSPLLQVASEAAVKAGGALAVDRDVFSKKITEMITENENIDVFREEVCDIERLASEFDAVVVATGPLTSDGLSASLEKITGTEEMAFFDAAAPIVMADSIDMDKVFFQNRYERDDARDAKRRNADRLSLDDTGGTSAIRTDDEKTKESEGDYLNIPFTKEEYERFIDELVEAKRVIAKDFETKDLFQACQPIEEIARKGRDTPRHGTMKPVGLIDPKTGKRPWAALQLRKEDASGQSYNLVGFQTNLTFPEQKRVFSMIPGLENAEFARYGVMHRNTYICAPKCIDKWGKLVCEGALSIDSPIYIAGQLCGTEGYCEAIRSGHHCALAIVSELSGSENSRIALPDETVFGSLMEYASDPATKNYQPMHVNFGIMKPLDRPVRNKALRYKEYACRAQASMNEYIEELRLVGIPIDSECS